MPTPSNFSPTEQFQDSIRRIFNSRIREYFADVELDDDLSSDRGHLKYACLHKENDSLPLTTARFLLFYNLKFEQALNSLVGSNNEDELKPLTHYGAANHPKVTLFFSQDDAAVPEGKNGVEAQCSFRLMEYLNYKLPGEVGDVIDELELRAVANRIKSEFRNYRWQKGDKIYTYSSPPDGFMNSQIYARTQTIAEALLKKLCDVRQKEFKKELLRESQTPNARSRNRSLRKVTGYNNRSVDEPVYRPTAIVRFRYAIVDVGRVQPVVLYDTTGMLQSLID